MSPATPLVRKALILAPGQGRPYPMGRMRALFIADTAETDSRYSVSEWWLDSNTQGLEPTNSPRGSRVSTLLKER